MIKDATPFFDWLEQNAEALIKRDKEAYEIPVWQLR